MHRMSRCISCRAPESPAAWEKPASLRWRPLSLMLFSPPRASESAGCRSIQPLLLRLHLYPHETPGHAEKDFLGHSLDLALAGSRGKPQLLWHIPILPLGGAKCCGSQPGWPRYSFSRCSGSFTMRLVETPTPSAITCGGRATHGEYSRR